MNHELYLRRRGKIALPPTEPGGALLSPALAATVAKNAESLGFAFSPELVEASRRLPLAELAALNTQLQLVFARMKGAHRKLKPMYPNFPAGVMQMSEAELYLNALLHYWTDGKFMPPSEKKPRLSLKEPVELTPVRLGSEAELEEMFAQIVGGNAAFSQQDKDDVSWFTSAYSDRIGAMLPETIPQKENMAFVAGQLMKYVGREQAEEFVARYTKTATDVLRLAVALSGGDVSLAVATKFRTFTRPERALLLALLERIANATEDMLRWKGRWIRLGEKLHPGEFANRFPRAKEAFVVLRNDTPFTTFNSAVEKALAARNVAEAVQRLSTRPGDFARRLDHLLRVAGNEADTVLTAFDEGTARISTPVLLQVMHHFAHRQDNTGLRVFFPKGNLAKAQGISNTLPVLPAEVCQRVSETCARTLRTRFAALPGLGRVYVDPALKNYPVPFALRSASKSLRTLSRGTRLPLLDCETLRFFVWWKNGKERTDIDLSAAMFNNEFAYVDVLSYYNLQGFGGVHSGDIVDAPEGASEFIDVSLTKLREKGVRFVVMALSSYTQQPYVELPECFAGWMARKEAGSGEVFEPKTVRDHLDLTADTKIALPLFIDVVENQVVWCDMSLRAYPSWVNNVDVNQKGITLTLRSMLDMKKPNLYELFTLHGQARGQLVDEANNADTVFSVGNETPYRLEEITSGYMA